MRNDCPAKVRCYPLAAGDYPMKTTTMLVAGLALVLAATAAQADYASYEWKTYSQVAFPGDGMLSCTGLKNMITGIEADLAQMEKIRIIIEQKLDSAAELQSNSGNTPEGTGRHYGDKNRQLHQMRSDINASRQVAKDRIAYLNTLVPNCRAATVPAK